MDRFDPYPWLEGERISAFAGRVVVKCSGKNGQGFVAKKVRHRSDHLESEAHMLKYATEVAHVKAPKLHYVYAQENARLMVTDFVSGVPLDTVWQSLDDANRASIRKDLQEQIRRMRTCTKSSIGRVNIDGGLDAKAAFPDPCHPSIDTSCMAFANEHDFDDHKIDEVRKRSVAAAADMQKRIQQLSKTYTQKFVLTHGDLNSRNIHVKSVVDTSTQRMVWQISGILDWERSAIFPEYMEYALARISISHDVEWRKFLVGLLEDMQVCCSEERVAVEYIATDRF
jgi:aminoglycoside phosphotransferase (APT) family kinase protein